ncbi:asparagine synthase (glutamine-hydrolyzing) [Paenisporosarcina quisquiliarum]|uniref:asparagine synthase (glutamine-hydrolyzing) n=1 Tax=Paenisporosarcina quisquiliarum TaxID=365346 RepID=A0A9X3LH34_9BACL|nr:asparagine synthase (glutamine-hydrolyzing) [Paenisporosarcina quisquiliarum]MCZ8537862.1 asparagine synthase (glutamine-hydrolyzing) [Paenisporosarcina quisquiliarum]
MCGFVGILYNHPQEITDMRKQEMEDITSLIGHRGPDDEGCFVDEHVSFGFRRLSIVDIEGGHQPLSYENERYWIIFNGEIYNHIELRDEQIAKGHEFSSESDTEVLLALYSALKEKMVHKLRGMFAFVIWDKEEQLLFGARDHFGIKPFFYLEKEDTTYFASEKKAILLVEPEELDTDSLQHYLSFQYVPEPNTMTRAIKKLPAGHYFRKKLDQPMNIQSFWTPKFHPVHSSENQLIHEIRNVLTDSVHVHMRSDVPVGSFLSGGIDSSFIVSLAKEVNPQLKTFTVGFETSGYSEVNIAQETADILQLENTSYIISSEEFLEELPKIVWHLDDPLADPALIPLYFVAREAAKQVKVVLSGEGADELFGGYNIYREPHSLRIFNHMPQRVKEILKVLSRLIPEGFKGRSFIERGTTPLEQRYIGNAKMFEENEKRKLLRTYQENLHYTGITKPIYQQSMGYDAVTKMQNIDIHTWLKGDILVKADKMTMAHSLELRVPFLDTYVFDVASKIQSNQKIKANTTKYMLRKAAEGIVPEHVVNRKKLGFPVPIRHWLKDELYEWAINLIHTSQTETIFNKHEVFQLLADHVTNKKDNSRKLWTILIFMVWHQVYVEKIYDFNR